MLNLCTVNTSLFKVSFSYLLERNLQLEQKHSYKIESLVVLQSKGLTRVQTVNSTFCKREHNNLDLRIVFRCIKKAIGESKLS